MTATSARDRRQTPNQKTETTAEVYTQQKKEVPAPILKDHLDVEAAVNGAPVFEEVSLFAANSDEVESSDFHKMVLLNYGSVDGRLEDDEDDDGTSRSSDAERSIPKVTPPSHEDVTSRKTSRKAGNGLPAESSRSEMVVHSPVRWPPSSSSDDFSASKDNAIVSTTTDTKEPNEMPPSSVNRKRAITERKARGRPRKSVGGVTTPKARRPRGRPRKDGGGAVRKAQRKSIVKKSPEHLQTRRPRRAVALIQDFLELYAEVDLADLEYLHTRATTFVKMLVDEYLEENKVKFSKSPSRDVQSSSLRKDSLNSSADMETEVGPSDIDDNEEDVESSAEEFTPGYNSGPGPGGAHDEDGTVNDHRFGPRGLSDNFIDSIPVIRGTVLQPMPTVIDST